MEEKNKNSESVKDYAEENTAKSIADTEVPLDKNIRLMSPTRMVVRRFFRSKLSVIGLVLIIALFLFSWIGPLFWNVSETDRTMKIDYDRHPIEYVDENGESHFFYQIVETGKELSSLAPPSAAHPLGTDMSGRDNLTRLMTGGRVSLSISFLAVFIIMLLGVIFGGLAGYFGGVIDNIIMRACDILMCLPGIPVMLIVNTVLEGLKIDSEFRIYYLMGFLTLISWSGTARLVRGQILSLREQEYVLSAKASGAKSSWIIRKHLIPNCISVIIISTALQIPSAIFTESYLSFLGLGVNAPMPSLGSLASDALNGINSYPYRLVIPAIVISLIVLSLNLLGDGLRDAFDPKLNG